MDLKSKIKSARYQNKTLPSSFKKYKDLLLSNQKKDISKENKNKKLSLNTFKTVSLISFSKLNQSSASKTKEKISNFSKQSLPLKLFKKKILNEEYNQDTIFKNYCKTNNNNNNKKFNSRNKFYRSDINNLNSTNNQSINIKDLKKNIKKYSISNKKNKINLNKLYFGISRNAINFLDRNRLRATKTINLKLYEKFEEETKKLNDNKNEKNNVQINNFESLTSNKNFIYNSSKSFPEIKEKKFNEINNEIKNNINNKNNLNKFNLNNFGKKSKMKYSLKKLMELNPYHLVPKDVRFSNFVEIKKISQQLSYVNGAFQDREDTSQKHFFKDDINFENYKNLNFNSKIINSVTVTYSNNYSWRKGELVWRILEKMKKKPTSSSFRQACLFQGYTELWKYYGVVLEKMLVNYSEYKWFITKEKFMSKEVFTEFIQYMDIKINENKSFPDKVFLLFDITGSNKINIKIFYFIMELTSNSSKYLEKIYFILELCEDIKKKNYVKVLEMQEIIRSMILIEHNEKYYSYLHDIIIKEFNCKGKISNNFYITKKQLLDFLLNNEFIKRLFILFDTEYKNAYISYNEEVHSSFNSTVRNIKKFLNEQNEVSCFCEHDLNNYEKILKSIDNKVKILERNKLINE